MFFIRLPEGSSLILSQLSLLFYVSSAMPLLIINRSLKRPPCEEINVLVPVNNNGYTYSLYT